MISITNILREVTMENSNVLKKQSLSWFKRLLGKQAAESVPDPFRVLVHKEISDHIKSWRFIILIALFP
ncbi:hypothetical protein JCM21142_397 [Saccharicrinis fermentans DSM 9555 = JCM 21142]|uniref:Uncharacterized protein n=2 Tax=Saccharicrinis fermentans TaxID=982 RepID=W7XUS9_9BACT|nr:hypothetical protein JCM21142_397 [Saccharicrinis fermentans DSM 9555 = JCM 21142]